MSLFDHLVGAAEHPGRLSIDGTFPQWPLVGPMDNAKNHVTRHSPVRGSRRKVGGTSRLTGSIACPFFTRSSSAFMRRTSFITRRTITPAASALRARTTMGGIEEISPFSEGIAAGEKRRTP